MTPEVNLKTDKKRRKFRLGWIFFMSWIIPLVVVLITLSNQEEKYIDLPEQPGKIVGGSIAYDGQYYWATRILVSFGAEIQREIVRFDPSNGAYNIFTPELDFRGFAYDGERLWVSDATGSDDYTSADGNFYIVDQESSAFIKKFSIHQDYLLDGITAGDQKLWVLGRHAEQQNRVFLWAIDQYSGSIIHEVEVSEDLIMPCSGIAFFDGYIWAVSGLERKEVVKISPYDGRILHRYDFSGSEINGITTDGLQIMLADGDLHQLYSMDTAE